MHAAQLMREWPSNSGSRTRLHQTAWNCAWAAARQERPRKRRALSPSGDTGGQWVAVAQLIRRQTHLGAASVVFVSVSWVIGQFVW